MIIVYSQIPNKRLPTEKFPLNDKTLNVAFIRLESYDEYKLRFYNGDGSYYHTYDDDVMKSTLKMFDSHL